MISKLVYKVLNKLVKVSDKHIYFESEYYFYDNSYVLYEYIKKNYPKYKLHYACYKNYQLNSFKNKNISKKEIVDYTSVHSILKRKLLNLKNYYIERKCSLVFASYLIDNFKKFDNVKDGRKIVMLWHATLGIKSVDKTMMYHFDKKNNYFYVNPTIKCEELRKKTSKAFENCFNVVCGKPRNDLIYENTISKNKFDLLCGVDTATVNVILTCCTFRVLKPMGDRDLFLDEFPLKLTNKNLQEINYCLAKYNSLLLIKTHHVQSHLNLDKYKGKFSNIIFRDSNDFDYFNININEIFPYTKALITDYSSIYFDYLCVNKPVGFIHNDINVFEKKRGLTSKEILSLLVGERINNKNQLCDFISHICDTEDEEILKTRAKISKEINGEYKSNCQSVCDYFGIK